MIKPVSTDCATNVGGKTCHWWRKRFLTSVRWTPNAGRSTLNESCNAASHDIKCLYQSSTLYWRVSCQNFQSCSPLHKRRYYKKMLDGRISRCRRKPMVPSVLSAIVTLNRFLSFTRSRCLNILYTVQTYCQFSQLWNHVQELFLQETGVGLVQYPSTRTLPSVVGNIGLAVHCRQTRHDNKPIKSF